MKKMPAYDVTKTEQRIIDNIPEAVKAKDPQKICDILKNLYLEHFDIDYGSEDTMDSANTIIEKYLFRAYELLFFVKDIGEDFDYDGFFFDEAIHNEIFAEAKAKLDVDEAAINCAKGVVFIRLHDYDEAGKCFRDSALGGNPDGAFNYGVTVSRGEGCEADVLLGSFWYWFAACEGNAKAMFNLAYNYRNSLGVKHNAMHMVYWYISAALAGNEEAAIIAASYLTNGVGFPGLEDAGIRLLYIITHPDEETPDIVNGVFKEIVKNLKRFVRNTRY